MNDQWPISFLTSVILLLILVSSSFAQTTISQNLIEFKHKDKIIRNLPLAELERYLTKQTLKIFEVHEKKNEHIRSTQPQHFLILSLDPTGELQKKSFSSVKISSSQASQSQNFYNTTLILLLPVRIIILLH